MMYRLLAMSLICGVATTAFARPPMLAPLPEVANYQPQPTPSEPPAPVPMPENAIPQGAIVVPGQPSAVLAQPGVICDACDGAYLPLYKDVKVIQKRNIAPCAVPKIVAVPDPCNPCGGCVFVCICVPPCTCETVRCDRHKDRVIFDYGEYQVKVTNRRGTLVVNYDD